MTNKHTIITPDGPMTRAEAADYYNINRSTLTRRLWEGWSVRKALETPTGHDRYVKTVSARRKWRSSLPPFVSAYGYLPLREIADTIDVPYDTLRNRVYIYGWGLEDAFNTPAGGTRGKHFIMPPEEYRESVAPVRRQAGVLIQNMED